MLRNHENLKIAKIAKLPRNHLEIVSKLSQNCLKIVSKLSLNYLKIVLKMRRNCLKIVSKSSQNHLKIITKSSRGSIVAHAHMNTHKYLKSISTRFKLSYRLNPDSYVT